MTPLIYIFPALIAGGFVYLLYLLIDGFRPSIRVDSRAYLTCFLLEMLTIAVLPEQVLMTLGLRSGSAIGYSVVILTEPLLIMKSIFYGKEYDYLVILLLPILPALIGYPTIIVRCAKEVQT